MLQWKLMVTWLRQLPFVVAGHICKMLSPCLASLISSCGCSDIITPNRMWVFTGHHMLLLQTRLLCICAPVCSRWTASSCRAFRAPKLTSRYLRRPSVGVEAQVCASEPASRWCVWVYSVWRSSLLQLGARHTFFAPCLRQFPPLVSL